VNTARRYDELLPKSKNPVNMFSARWWMKASENFSADKKGLKEGLYH
jgi:hypothetical protein